jgi:hypothetical protein
MANHKPWHDTPLHMQICMIFFYAINCIVFKMQCIADAGRLQSHQTWFGMLLADLQVIRH